MVLNVNKNKIVSETGHEFSFIVHLHLTDPDSYVSRAENSIMNISVHCCYYMIDYVNVLTACLSTHTYVLSLTLHQQSKEKSQGCYVWGQAIGDAQGAMYWDR